jgi:proteasome lid subunit RPN8/RPN11
MYPDVREWRIAADAIPHIYAELRADGDANREGIAMLGGSRRDAGVAVIDTVLLLRGRGVRRDTGLLDVDFSTMNALTDALVMRRRSLVGQVHSHPPHCSTDLSFTDQRYGIAVPGFLSIVVPDYGRPRRGQPAESWGVHVFDQHKGWIRLTLETVLSSVRVDTEVPCESVLVTAAVTNGS